MSDERLEAVAKAMCEADDWLTAKTIGWDSISKSVKSCYLDLAAAALAAADQFSIDAALDAVHPDDIAVDQFAKQMKAKLAQKRAEGRGGWEDRDVCSTEFLSTLLRDHVEKGDPLDVANFAMMLHMRGDRILAACKAAKEAHDGE